MNLSLPLGQTLLAGLLLAGTAGAQPSLTLYNQEFAVVREQLPLKLQKGVQDLSVSTITAHLEPASVILRDPSGKASVRILEQNYRNDPVSQERLLQHFEGKEIEFQRTHADGTQELLKGTIVRAPYVAHEEAMRRFQGAYAMNQSARAYGSGNAPIIQVAGKLMFSLPGQPVFPALADDSILRPTLSWKLQTSQALTTPLELSYVSGGFTWAADYNLLLPEKGSTCSLIGWVTMDNQSGRSFPEAAIKLMAGDVSKIQQHPGIASGPMVASGSRMNRMAEFKPTVTQKSFDEYHLYTLARPTTLRDRETKQVEFVRAEGITSTLSYIYNGALIDWNRYSGHDPESLRNDRNFGTQTNKKVWVYREFANTEANKLGIPLPKGRVRFYRQDSDRRLEFIGENEIDHSPAKEPVKVYTGDAFDLVGERRRTNHKLDTSADFLDESFEIKLRNRKKEPVVIKVVENLYRWSNWEITTASDPWKKTDSQTMEFLVKLEPDQKKTITYTVRYTW